MALRRFRRIHKNMFGIASATGLVSARVQPIRRPKPKNIDLSSNSAAAPFALRPFAGLFNPYPYGCSVLCNHPADYEAKEVVRRAKDTWATEGKALLLPDEMEMIRTELLAAASGGDATMMPEELFREYTETDSRPFTPTPTLASGPVLTNRAIRQDFATCDPRERTTLILDLRANPRKQLVSENETFTWHALTLEPPPTPRKGEIFVSKPILRQRPPPPPPPPLSSPSNAVERCETDTTDEINDNSEQPVIIRRRGKRLRKRKCRRGSAYGHQTEVRDLLEPTVTQVSQIGDGSRRPSYDKAKENTAEADGGPTSPKGMPGQTGVGRATPSSFLAHDILKHLCRELDRDKIEAEFSTKRRIALEEALRVKGDTHSTSRGSGQINTDSSIGNAPRIFSRQTARFELLDSQSLLGLTPLRYLGKYVYVSAGRKVIFGRIFNRFNEDKSQSVRRILANDVEEAVRDLIGRVLTDQQRSYLRSVIGRITASLNFKEWCGLCAAVERLLCPLPPKENDPPTWLERVDFEALERRLESVKIDTTLALLLKEIRDR